MKTNQSLSQKIAVTAKTASLPPGTGSASVLTNAVGRVAPRQHERTGKMRNSRPAYGDFLSSEIVRAKNCSEDGGGEEVFGVWRRLHPPDVVGDVVDLNDPAGLRKIV
jgi:hypothetical protein